MFKILVWAFVIYILYKLIFEFVLPIAKATSTMRSKIQEMQNEQMRQSETNNNTHTSQQSNETKPFVGEYIDFEEVKEG